MEIVVEHVGVGFTHYLPPFRLKCFGRVSYGGIVQVVAEFLDATFDFPMYPRNGTHGFYAFVGIVCMYQMSDLVPTALHRIV